MSVKTKITDRKRPSHPSTPSKSSDKRREDAYERLGVTPQQVASLPQISHILSQLPQGGIKKAIEFLRGSDSPKARKWLEVYDSLPESTRKLLPFEAFCLASGLSTKEMLEVVTGACFEQSASTTQLLAKAAHPAVVKATVQNAKTMLGAQDRKMLHQHMGFLPMPKTQFIAARGNVQIGDGNQQANVSVGELGGVEKQMARITDRFNTERLGLAGGNQSRLLSSNPEHDVESTDDTDNSDPPIEAEFEELE